MISSTSAGVAQPGAHDVSLQQPRTAARWMFRLTATILFGLIVVPRSLRAQKTQLDVHGNYAVGTESHSKSWGGGLGLQMTFGSTTDPINLSLSPGIDYLKQEKGGPSQTSASLDLNIEPGGNSTVTPYVGASASSNWSGGSTKQWEGAKLGLDTMAGAQVKLSSALSAKAEERFGYVKGQEHTLTTRIGVLVSF